MWPPAPHQKTNRRLYVEVEADDELNGDPAQAGARLDAAARGSTRRRRHRGDTDRQAGRTRRLRRIGGIAPHTLRRSRSHHIRVGKRAARPLAWGRPASAGSRLDLERPGRRWIRSSAVVHDVASADDPVPVGQLLVPFAVSAQAVAAGPDPEVDQRATTRLIFFDAVDPNPPEGQFPKILHPQWTIEPRIRGFSPCGERGASEGR